VAHGDDTARPLPQGKVTCVKLFTAGQKVPRKIQRKFFPSKMLGKIGIFHGKSFEKLFSKKFQGKFRGK
jgi:hypothetical protein